MVPEKPECGTDEQNVTPNIAERIFREIRRAIVEGQIPPGSKISEPELARRFGSSRGPLREAIGRLESCRLLERKPNVGARVVRLSATQLLEIFHVREALEGMAARLSAERMQRAEVKQIEELLGAHRQQIEEEAGRSYFQQEGDLDFHYRIVRGSRNQQLIQILCNDLYQLLRMYRYQFGMASPRAPAALREHEHIVEAIADGDAELAEILMRRHIRASRRNAERRMQETGAHGVVPPAQETA